jgi:hypothetical protein
VTKNGKFFRTLLCKKNSELN